MAPIQYKMNVVLLALEWGTKSDAELSIFYRELSKQLAKLSGVQVSVLLPHYDQEEKNEALNHNITLVEPTERHGFDDETHYLCFPPENLKMDFVIGHGVQLGSQAEYIREKRNCKWIQFVHNDPEEEGMYKGQANAISKGEREHQDEVNLCAKADLVVAVGPKLAEAYRSYLRFWRKDVFVLTPGIFNDFSNIGQSKLDGRKRRVLVFGNVDIEDFCLKGIDIAAKAVAKLNDAYLIVIGTAKQDEVAGRLKEYDIPPSRLRIRSLTEISVKQLMSEVDLAIMPSRTEGFGLVALEAMSAGLPVLVSANSGFGEVMKEDSFGSSYVIDSQDAEVWARKIEKVWAEGGEAEALRNNYAEKYNWEQQCRDLVEKMRGILNGKKYSGSVPL